MGSALLLCPLGLGTGQHGPYILLSLGSIGAWHSRKGLAIQHPVQELGVRVLSDMAPLVVEWRVWFAA